MKKLLYFTHVPWNWIKQRPQFIAEKLSQCVELTYAEGKNLKSVFKRNHQRNKTDGVRKVGYLRVPRYNPTIFRSYKILDLLNLIFLKLSINLNSYEYVWITSIESYHRIAKILPTKVKLIYDCMDDELEFPQVCNNTKARAILSEYEKELVRRADVIICSAENLKQQIINRTNTKKVIHVINNATVYPIAGQNLEFRNNFVFDAEKQSMLYIGTIAKWFDFNTIITLLNSDKNLVCYLIGPLETNLPNHERLIHLGKCTHNEIWGIMKQADILLMPFVLNPLIESVNPVKLYEYIWAEKPIIATRYGESMKFDEYCYLYSSKEEAIDIYKTLKYNSFFPKQSSIKLIKEFVENNTWDSRCKEIVKIAGIR